MDSTKSISIILTFLCALSCTLCDVDDLKKKVSELRSKGKELYGKVKKNGTKEWEYQLEDRLAYPRGDKWKLGEISAQWSAYYECLQRQAEGPAHAALTARSLMTYVGMVLVVECPICLSPEGRREHDWWYSENIQRPTFSPLYDKESTVRDPNGTLTIYGATRDDAGVYLCRLGATNGSRVYVEVVDEEEKYIVVKTERATSGAWPLAPAALGGGAELRGRRDAWSGCSACGRVGRRRRLAVCCVVLPTTEDNADGTSLTDDAIRISADTIALLKVFPEGIPCRSKLLPKYLRDEPRIRNRPSEIMIGLCKVPCKENLIFEVRTADGRVVEHANNSAGIYSMLQTPPAQPPPPARDIIFAYRLQTVKLLCPGSLFTDALVRWRVGALDVVPRVADKESGGRVYVSARDQLVITSLRLTDSNLYSCWQRGKLAGAVKLLVSEGHTLHYDRHLTLLGLAVISAVALRLALRTLRNRRRHIAMR